MFYLLDCLDIEGLASPLVLGLPAVLCLPAVLGLEVEGRAIDCLGTLDLRDMTLLGCWVNGLPKFHGQIIYHIHRRSSSTDISTGISPVCSSTAVSGDVRVELIIKLIYLREIPVDLHLRLPVYFRRRSWRIHSSRWSTGMDLRLIIREIIVELGCKDLTQESARENILIFWIVDSS